MPSLVPFNLPTAEVRVLLIAPTRRDGDAICRLLECKDATCLICDSMPQLCEEFGRGAGALIVSEESLRADHGRLTAELEKQPVWSDIPIIVLSNTGAESPWLGSILAHLGNVSVLERPVRMMTLLSVVRSALRARARQFQVRENLEQRERSEAELRHSHEQTELVVQGANVGLWFCPLPFDKLNWDSTVKEHFHLPPDAEVTIDTFYERIHPDDREPTRVAIENSLASSRKYDVEYRTVSPGGERTSWIRAIGRGFYDNAGNAVRFDGITMDVTSRVLSEEALRQSEQRLRAVVEATPECVKIVAPDGALVFMNPAGIRLIEADDLKSVAGACVFDLIAPEHRVGWLARHARICAGERLDWEFEIVGLAGTRRWMETHAVPLPLPNGQVGQLAVTREISARKQVEFEREQLLELERTARVEAERVSRMKDEFLATLSHELRTPLNAILGWAQILRRHDTPVEDMHEGLEIIERSARAQTQIIEDLLDMSRIISGKIRLDVQRVELAEVMSDAIETVRHAADARGIRLRATLDPAAGPVSGDPNRLQQVFWNLLSNAVKFTPRGGRVEVLLERVDSHLEVRVIDSGEGITGEFLPQVFDRFRQADASTTRRHGGLGLGLAIVKQLVELHGGSIRAQSAGLGRGATFTVLLPLTPIQEEPAVAPERAHPTAGENGEKLDVAVQIAGLKLVIVDDEPDARGLLRRLLEECAATVYTAASAQEGAEMVMSLRPDVLISDIGMPGEDGYSLIRRVRALPADAGGETPAVALTAYARPEDRVSALLAGFQHHLAKPVEPAELIAVVASLGRRVR